MSNETNAGLSAIAALQLEMGKLDHPAVAIDMLTRAVHSRGQAMGLGVESVSINATSDEVVATLTFDMHDEDGRPWTQVVRVPAHPVEIDVSGVR